MFRISCVYSQDLLYTVCPSMQCLVHCSAYIFEGVVLAYHIHVYTWSENVYPLHIQGVTADYHVSEYDTGREGESV